MPLMLLYWLMAKILRFCDDYTSEAGMRHPFLTLMYILVALGYGDD